MPDKIIYADFTETGRADIYIIMNRPADAFLLANVNGTFEAAPASYPLLTEAAARKQSYSVTITGSLADGDHPFSVYAPVGATQDPTVDDHIAGGVLKIKDNAEIELDASVAAIQGVVSQGVPHFYYPTSIVRVIGSDEGGDVNDLAAHDEVMFGTGEVVGAGLEVIATFATTSIDQIPSLIRIPAFYNGGATHYIEGYVWNYTLAAWEYKFDMLSRTTAFDYEVGLTTDHHDPLTGEIMVRFKHAAFGTYNAGHRLWIDMLQASKVETANSLAADIANIFNKVAPLTFTGSNVNATNLAGLTGIQSVTLQFYRTATTTPIPDVVIDVYDSTETARLNGIQLKSNVSGQIVIGRDNGTYKVRAMLAGFNFVTTSVVVNSADQTVIIYGDAAAADAPPPASAIRVYDYCFLPDGVTPMAAADVKASMNIHELPYDYNGRLHSGKTVAGTYNASTGKVYWDIAPGALCSFFIKNAMDIEIKKRIPMTAPGNEIRVEAIP